jgi:hypothetical protein
MWGRRDAGSNQHRRSGASGREEPGLLAAVTGRVLPAGSRYASQGWVSRTPERRSGRRGGPSCRVCRPRSRGRRRHRSLRPSGALPSPPPRARRRVSSSVGGGFPSGRCGEPRWRTRRPSRLRPGAPGEAPREGRRHSSPASSVRAGSASRRGGTYEPLSSRMACIARCSDTSAARTFSPTASRAGGSASSRKWRRGGASVLSSSSQCSSSAVRELHQRVFPDLSLVLGIVLYPYQGRG